MRTLIYTLAYGDEFWECAQLMNLSLRTWGEYTGDILVYTDRDGVIDGATVMRDTLPLALPSLFMAKAMFGRSTPIGYDRVMFLDADCVVLNPINPLLHFEGDLSLPAEMVDDIMGWKDWYSLPDNPCQQGDLGLNAGTIACRGSLWPEACHLWWDTMLQYKTWTLPGGIDQPVINHLVRAGHWHFKPFPREWFFFFTKENGPIHRHTIIVHPKHHKLPTMRAIINMRSLWT